MGGGGMNLLDLTTISILLIVWIITFSLVLPKIRYHASNKVNLQEKLSKVLGFDNVKAEAENVGWRLGFKEYIIIVGFSILTGVVIAYTIGNVFFIIAGAACSFLLPRYIVIKIKKKKRMALLMELPDNLKIFTSKLMDFPSIKTSVEAALPDMTGELKIVFEKLYTSLSVSISINKALMDAAEEIKIQKFTNYVEKLLMANSQGFHHESMESLNETIDDIEFDIRTIKQLEIQAKSKKRTFYIVIGGTWLMSFMVSKLNTDDTNIFLDTWYGQVFIASLFASTVFSMVKADDFLSLNLDEL